MRDIEKKLNQLEPNTAQLKETERIVDRLDEVNLKLVSLGEKIDSIQIPDVVEVSNFPEQEKTEFPEFPEIPAFPDKMKVEVTNHKDVQKVEVLNQIKIPPVNIDFPEQKEVVFPEVQRVEVINPTIPAPIIKEEIIFPEVQKSLLVDKDGEPVNFEKLAKEISSAPQFVASGGGISTGTATETTLKTLAKDSTVATLAKETTLSSIVVLETTLNSLTQTLQELVQRLAPLAGAMSNTAQLRVTQTAVPSTAVTGPITSAQSIAEKNIAGVMYTQRVSAENLTAITSNINNVVGK